MKPFSQWTSADIVEFLKSVDQKTWIKVGAGTLGAILFIYFIVCPGWFTRPGLKSRLKDTEGQIRMVESLSLQKPALLKNKSETITFIKTSKEKLFKPGETSLLLGTISKLANESKVSVIASSPKESSEKFPAPFDATYEANLYDFTVEGGYHEIGSLVGRIESHPKLFRIQSFQIRPSQTKGKGMNQVATMTVVAVSLKEGAPK